MPRRAVGDMPARKYGTYARAGAHQLVPVCNYRHLGKAMCSDPITTIDHETGETITFACRRCNECIAARKNDWIARAMAEKATSGEVVVLGLSYRNEPDGTQPAAARSFRYEDIQMFLKRLRKAYWERYKKNGEVRFIVAGERGSDNNRVHWHMVLFADRPITNLGRWYKEFPTPKGIGWRAVSWRIWEAVAIRLKLMPLDKRCHWSFWPHGHVHPQVPDQGGMAYVMKYALKDQFNALKSKGTMREGKGNNHGASYFRMSKSPPIGFRWLEAYCEELAARETVPPTANVKPPEYSGYWFVKGRMREWMLQRFHEINQARRDKHGHDCAQWNALVHSVMSEEKDWEILQYGEEQKRWFPEGPAEGRWSGSVDATDSATANRIRANCGQWFPCWDCWQALSAQQKQQARYGEYYQGKYAQNPFCKFKHREKWRDAFDPKKGARRKEFDTGRNAHRR